MKTIGYLISHKNNERRRALLPNDAERIQHRSMITVEHDYGAVLGYSDDDYLLAGVSVAPRKQVLGCDALVDVKLGDADFMGQISPRKTLIGWSHILQKPDFTDTAIAVSTPSWHGKTSWKTGDISFIATASSQAKPPSCMHFVTMGVCPMIVA